MAALHGSAEVGIGIQSVAHVPSGYARLLAPCPRLRRGRNWDSFCRAGPPWMLTLLPRRST